MNNIQKLKYKQIKKIPGVFFDMMTNDMRKMPVQTVQEIIENDFKILVFDTDYERVAFNVLLKKYEG